MYLSKIKYQKKDQSKILVVLVLGRRQGKLVCILDSCISDNDADIIKTNSGKLTEYTLTNKIGWFKDKMPHLYRNGYKEIYLERVQLLKSYPIK